MTFFSQLPTRLTRLTKGYAVVWLLALIVWRIGDWLPQWLLAIAFLPSLPLGIAWIRQLRAHHDHSVRSYAAIVLTAIYLCWWQLSVFLAEFAGIQELRSGLTWWERSDCSLSDWHGWSGSSNEPRSGLSKLVWKRFCGTDRCW